MVIREGRARHISKLAAGRNLIVHDMIYHLFAEPEKAKLKNLAPEQVVYKLIK